MKREEYLENPISNHFTLLAALRFEQAFLRSVQWTLSKKQGINDPPALIRTYSRRKKPYYYLRKNGADKNGVFIPREEREFVREMLQANYEKDLFKQVGKSLDFTDKSLLYYEQDAIRELYNNLHENRRELVTPILQSDEEYVKEWESFSYVEKGFSFEDAVIMTERGERVRSKSEKILADKFLKMGIPYRYECPLFIESGLTIHPDFSVLNVRKHKVYYWEHCGRMDDPKYVVNLTRRLDTYTQKGIYQGESLILTFETQMQPLSTQTVQSLIEHFLL